MAEHMISDSNRVIFLNTIIQKLYNIFFYKEIFKNNIYGYSILY